jgi:hypothetical protein
MDNADTIHRPNGPGRQSFLSDVHGSRERMAISSRVRAALAPKAETHAGKDRNIFLRSSFSLDDFVTGNASLREQF